MSAATDAEVKAIIAAHPMRTGKHDQYVEAMRLVGERHGKGELVELVNWLLCRIERAEADAARLREAWLHIIQADNKCRESGLPCADKCGCHDEQAELIKAHQQARAALDASPYVKGKP